MTLGALSQNGLLSVIGFLRTAWPLRGALREELT